MEKNHKIAELKQGHKNDVGVMTQGLYLKKVTANATRTNGASAAVITDEQLKDVDCTKLNIISLYNLPRENQADVA